MKISKIASLVLAGGLIIGMTTGCNDNGGGSNGIQASDAYVVAFKNGSSVGNVTVTCKEGNKTVTKTVEANITNPALGYMEFNESVDGCFITIPDTVYVDADLDGKYNPANDAVIRMPLLTMNYGTVANPIATAALAKYENNTSDTDALTVYQNANNFDPVQAKKQLILNPDDKVTQAKVALSDGVAFLAQEAKKAGKDPLEAVKAVDLSVVTKLDSNTTLASDVNTTLDLALAAAAKTVGVDINTIKSNVNNVITVIKTISNLVKAGKVKEDDINKFAAVVIAVSDKDPSKADTVIKKLSNINDINDTDEVFDDLISTLGLSEDAGKAFEGGNSENNNENNATTNNNENNATTTSAAKIIVGNTPITINNDGTFSANISNDKNLSAYYDINLTGFEVTGNDGSHDGNVTVTIENADKNATLKVMLQNVEIVKNGSALNTNFVAGKTKIGISPVSGLGKLKEDLGDSAVATVDKDYNTTGLAFDLDNIIDNAVQNEDKKEKVLNDLNTYFQETNQTYNVKVNVSIDGLTVNPNNISGTIKVSIENNFNCDKDGDGVNDGVWTDTPFGKVCK